MLIARRAAIAALAFGVATWVARGALAAPAEFLPVGDPIEAELRLLELESPTLAGFRRPHFQTRPLQRFELAADSAGGAPAGARSIATRRIARELARDAAGDRPRGATPRLLQREWPEGGRFELSAGLEGRRDETREDRGSFGRWADGSGVHLRLAAQADRWLVHSHVFAGQVSGGQSFADPLIADTDVLVQTEDAYVAYTGSPSWTAAFGRGRWHWGPGEEASLLLGRAAAPLTGATLRLSLPALRLDAVVLNAVLRHAEGVQLAAHRLEWQPADAVRIGVSEAAVYRSESWDPLYAVGVVPYVLAQRLETQDEPDSAAAVRNNVLFSLDGAVRVMDGTRVYGEWLVDDLHAKSAAFPNKVGVQLGLEGVGEIAGTRLSWGAEYTRLTRFVYTSYFGLPLTAQDRPLGFPTGPDSRRLRLRVSWDPTEDWQATLVAAQTDRGESGLDAPFVPGGPVPPSGSLSGVVERTRDLDAALRWWPATGLDAAIRAGWTRIENSAHVAGPDRTLWRFGAELRLTR